MSVLDEKNAPSRSSTSASTSPLKAVFESSDVERFAWVLMEV
jgi:hypothetical protein